MKKLLFLLFLLANGMMAQAQVAFELDSVATYMDLGKEDIVGHGIIKNLAPQVKDYRWEINRVSIPQGMDAAVCDKNSCYDPTVDAMDFNLGPAESGRMDVHLYPNGNKGESALIRLTVTDTRNDANTAEGTYFFSALLTSSQEAELLRLQVFPNPVAQTLQINGLERGEGKLELYSLDGRLMYQKIFRQSTTVTMADWPQGLYILKVKLAENGARFQQLLQKI